MVFIMLFFIPFCGYTQGFLKANGKIIVNEGGNKVILRGMGLGGWMLQEGYMFRLSSFGQQYKIKEKIEELIGKEKTEEFYNKWLTNHTTKADIDSLAKWGFNSVRLPMHYGLYTLPIEKEPVAGQNTWIEKGFTVTDSLLSWCKANKLYLILDLHAAPGGQGHDLAISDREPEKPSIWESEANQQKTVALWRKLAERYANETWIAGYDIINEPNWGFTDPKDKIGNLEKENKPLRKLLIDITRAIREVDQKHIIIIEGNAFGNNYNGIMPLWDNNLVVSFHKYGNFNNLESIQGFLNLQKENNMPLWLGESGENSNTWFTELISMVESHDIGWAWWQLKKMGVNNPLEIKITSGYQHLLDYWSGKAARPTPTEALAAIEELAENLRIEHNIYHKDVIDALFRQVKTTETKPFQHILIKTGTVVNAVDYDLGRQRFAYYDTDTASYHYTPGVNTVGNKGRSYRNDGVDIQKREDGYYVYSIESGEWLQYTLNVEKGGVYTVKLIVSAGVDSGEITINHNGIIEKAISIPNTNARWTNVTFKYIKLKAGSNKLVVMANKGGYDFKGIQFDRIK
ncbi:endoglucanase [Solitalea canadensis DSM 3403]|uniref:Endoglucanase n=2 Tax=Solitalea canadensis TaxID=995 RepID=H8KQ13_SOLCM|nr:endoglucanase [Solitalea canadensis DSM 3403]